MLEDQSAAPSLLATGARATQPSHLTTRPTLQSPLLHRRGRTLRRSRTLLSRTCRNTSTHLLVKVMNKAVVRGVTGDALQTVEDH
jgi:hypothetical protein